VKLFSGKKKPRKNGRAGKRQSLPIQNGNIRRTLVARPGGKPELQTADFGKIIRTLKKSAKNTIN
jgi:D-alanyl-D-alanine carboxypeptidase